MDEALLTGRFSVRPDMTRRSMSAKSSGRFGSSAASGERVPDDQSPLGREGSARPRSVSSRSSSRADTCLRRSRSAFDVELFRSQLRLNKSLSRNRFKQEVLDLALRPISAAARASSARAEPDGSELDTITGSVRESFEKDAVGQSEKDAVGQSEKDAVGQSEKDAVGQSEKGTLSERSEKNDGTTQTEEISNAKAAEDVVDGHDDRRNDRMGVKFQEREGLSSDAFTEDALDDPEDGPATAGRELSGKGVGASPGPGDVSKRSRLKRKDTLNVLTTHGAGPRMDRLDGAIVINPQRNKTRYDVTSELMSPRRFSPLGRANLSSATLLGSCSSPSTSSSGDEELAGLIGRSPGYQGNMGGCGGALDSGAATAEKAEEEGQGLFHVYESDSDQYDTDFEVDERSEFKAKERIQSASCLNTDFGHLTYEAACIKFKVVPRQRIMRQLPTRRLQVNYCGLNKMEAKALALGLLQNSRLDELDLASNGMDGPSVAYISDCFQRNIYITKLNLSGNFIEEEGAMSLGDMLKSNTWLTHLNLSDCGITDHEIAFLAKGIQENSTVVCLNLSKNKIEIHGGRHIGAALTHNSSVECLNLSWNMLRGGGSVAVCNSLQRNKTVRELNLAWNGLGFQGSLAISEALKVNRTLTKLDISSNRVDWDCAPYLARALATNRFLEVLELGYNPISTEGCMKLLEAIDRPSSSVRYLNLAEIPITNTIAFKATEISKKREFSLEHGGIISNRDVFGIKRIKREDPLTLLIRYLSTMGIRVVDLFRVFDTTSNLYVSQANFIRGLKRVRVPLDEEDMLRVARRMRSDKRGDISYQELAANVRRHIREERKEDLRLLRMEAKKREGRRRMLQSDLPLYVPPSFSYLPALYNMYGSHVINRRLDVFTPVASPKFSSVESIVSQRSSAAHFRGKTPSGSVLPRIDTAPRHGLSSPFTQGRDTASGRRFSNAVERTIAMGLGRRSPMTLVQHGTKGIPGSRRPLRLVGADKDMAVNTGAKGDRATPKELSDSPKDLAHSMRGLRRSPKRLSHSPKELGQTSKGLGHSPKDPGQSPKRLSQSPKELGQSPTESGVVPKGLPEISASRSLVAGKATRETSGASKPRLSPDKGRVSRARREMEFTDENRRL